LSSRNANPYHDFKVSNCMIRAEVFAAHPLDTRFRAYGYEDVFLGKQLEHHGIKVLHIDAPLASHNSRPTHSLWQRPRRPAHPLPVQRGTARLFHLIISCRKAAPTATHIAGLVRFQTMAKTLAQQPSVCTAFVVALQTLQTRVLSPAHCGRSTPESLTFH
jgi:hypothetical protein